MRFSIVTLFAALFVFVHAEPATAVQLYFTPDQGFPFQTPSDPREVDAIGAPGPSGLVAPVGPAESAVRFNLWVDPMGDTLTLLGLRLESLGGAVFADWDAGETLGATVPDDSFAIQAAGAIFTISNIKIDGRCNDFSGSASPGLPQGNCVGSGLGVPIFNGDPDQTAPMLLGTLTMDLTAGGPPGSTLVQIAVGPLSSYIVMGQEEEDVPFAPQVMLQAPEPAGFVLLAVALAALRARRRSAGWH